VKYLRKSEEFDLSQQALADALGVSRQTISEIESGKRNLTLALAYKIADFFNKDVNEIFFRDCVVSNLHMSDKKEGRSKLTG